MIMQLSHHVIDCPVCGRPVEVQLESFGHELACGHCRGRFVVYRSAEEQPTAATLREHSQLERTDRILQMPQRMGHESLTVIVVEQRDTVYARIADDVARFGVTLLRAHSVAEALRLVHNCDSAPLVLANRDLPGKDHAVPGQNGWVLADKLGRIAPQAEVWLYMPQVSAYAKVLAKYLRVRELIVHRGHFSSLSRAVTKRLGNRLGWEEKSRSCAANSSDDSNATRALVLRDRFHVHKRIVFREESA